MHLGEIPHLSLPQGAIGARLTHLDGISIAEFLFPQAGTSGNWVFTHQIPAEQARIFTEKLRKRAAEANPPIDLKVVSSYSAGIADDSAAAYFGGINHSYEEWKRVIDPQIWSRIFPAAAGQGPAAQAP